MADNRTNLPVNPETEPIPSGPPAPVANPPPPVFDPEARTTEGKGEAVKESVKEGRKTKEKLDKLVQLSQIVLIRISSVFPFDFFPTEVIVDLNQVVLVDKIFIGSQKIHSIFIANITDVLVHTGLIFATLEVIDSGFVENSIKIPKLRKDEARKARRIIQGLVIAKKQEIDLSHLGNVPDLIEKIEVLGESKS